MRPSPPAACLPFVALLAGCGQDYEVVAAPVDVNPGDVTDCAFTRVEDTEFYRYDCNPVFSTTGEDWADSIGGTTFLVTPVLDHPFYQMWYTGVTTRGSQEGEFGLGYAVSPNGTDWTPHGSNPLLTEPEDRDTWDADAMDGMQVIWDPTTEQYVNLYQGYNLSGETDWGLGVALSPDGVAWRRIDANPVVNLSEGVGPVDGWCWPLGLSLGEVAGFTGYVAGATNAGQCEVYRINGTNVGSWSPETDVVLPTGPSETWNDEGYASLAIAELDGTRYMFFVGFGLWTEQQISEDFVVRYATNLYLGWAENVDGQWVQKPDIIPINMTEDGNVSAVAADTVGSRIHLWVTDVYDDESAVGYFLFDPEAAAAEDAGGGTE